MLPTLGDGTPLVLCSTGSQDTPLAWPKLWKHHGAKAGDRSHQPDRPRAQRTVARPLRRHHRPRMVLPKVLETLNHAPAVYDAAEVWLEAGDWLVWQLIGGPFPHCTPATSSAPPARPATRRCGTSKTGYPSRDYFAAVHPKLAERRRRRKCPARSSPRAIRPGGSPTRRPQLLRPCAGHSRLRRDHRRPRRRSRRGRRLASTHGHGHRHQLLPHDEQPRRAARARASPASSRTESSPATSATRPARPASAMPSRGSSRPSVFRTTS